jgi:hypothetical protein
MIKHHVKEEEQRDGIFAQAKKAGVDMMELGRTTCGSQGGTHEAVQGFGHPHSADPFHARRTT